MGCVRCQLSGGWNGHVQAHDRHRHHDHVLYDHDQDSVHYDPVHYVCRVGRLDFLALTEQSSSEKGNEEVKLR